MIESKFKSNIYNFFIGFAVFGLIIFFINYYYSHKTGVSLKSGYLFIGIASVVGIANYLLFEGYLRIIKVKLQKNEISVSFFFGLLKEKIHNIKDIEGYHSYTREVGNSDDDIIETYECLYLIQEEKIIARISSQYHKNYNEMADFIKKHLTDLGYKKPNRLSEIKEIFRY